VFHYSITVSYFLVFLNFIDLLFKILTYLLSADFCGGFRLKGKSCKTFDIILSTKFVFVNFSFGEFEGGYSPSAPTLGAPLIIFTIFYS
jgi:hypothetical protein